MRFIALFIIALFCVGIHTQDVGAQGNGNTEFKVNYAYAFQLGFGSYDVGGLDVKVFKLPISYTFGLDSSGKLKLKVKSPVFYGRFRFRANTADNTRISVDQDVISVIPGLELQYEVLKNWYIKPFGDFGFAWTISDKVRPRNQNINVDDSTIYIYSLGIGSLYEIFWRRFKFSIGNALLWAGNSTFDGDDDESFGVFENGIDAQHPLGFTIKGYEPDLSAFFIYYRFIPYAEFSRSQRRPLRVKNQYEVAGTLGSATPFKVGFVKNPRIGVGYRFGDLEAFTINFGFPF